MSEDKQKSDKTVTKIPEAPEKVQPDAPKEIGGRGGLDPVRYGDWEIGGKCVDF